MAVVRSEGMALASKFRGCLAGVIMGDCLGHPFEGEEDSVSPVVLQKYLDKLEGPPLETLRKPYSDDTAMTRSITQSFVAKGCFDAKDVALRFVREYYAEPGRGYGANVREVFEKLKAQRCADPYRPASEQFNGRGSYGNGGAMRVAPVALFCHKEYDTLLSTAKRVTEITHTHPLGVNGALLQCIAVHQGLMLDPLEGPLDVESYINDLLKKMGELEHIDELEETQPYHDQLIRMKELLSKKDGVSVSEVQNALGNSVAAILSVPTAIFSFLYAQKPIKGIKTDSMFRRVIQYAISLGGDTDTIASMAGAIAGAYLGEEGLNQSLKSHCEGIEEMLKLADELYEISR